MSIKAGGLARKSVYISTEGEPPTARLMQMADAHVAAFPKAFERGHPLDHIFVEKVLSTPTACSRSQEKISQTLIINASFCCESAQKAPLSLHTRGG
jgi:hypothetical protein